MRESLGMEAGRSVLRMERRLAHPPEKVWRALTEPDDLARWFPSSVRVDLRVGGEIRFDFPDEPGVVTELDPPRVFAFTWGGELLRWEVRADGEGSLLLLTHTFDDRYGAPSFAAGWHTCLNAMDTALRGSSPPPSEEGGDMDDLLETYIEKLGLDRGVTDDTGVRFERQLSRPAAVVWQTLGGDPAGDATPEGFTLPRFPPGRPLEVKPPHLLEYTAGAGVVRWELRPGTGHGARLTLTHTCPPGDRETALTGWRTRIAHLAEQLARTPKPPRD
ncbi:SRPBCC family protein [Sphaerisporangium sp. TRM90804]|uniref:SRPBCC family protein n=1 Tax=Sphaerisporangium sp. TRM90804 TaxID=3031113 RepID=UPI0024496610|nr:SRPBCC family protein [Sphaerisporangium sp. TRM90804]MDH2426329.1 SRPBCC family protein [Sphaerisporangium sp. TRM90804]